MSCLRERAIFSMPISAAMSMSSCVDLVLSSVKLMGFSDGTCGSRRFLRLRFLRLRPPPWFSPSSWTGASKSAADSPDAACSVAAGSAELSADRLSLSVRVGLSSSLLTSAGGGSEVGAACDELS